jgi:hypothetical protein
MCPSVAQRLPPANPRRSLLHGPRPLPIHKTPQVVGFLGQQVLDDYRELLTGKLRQQAWAWSTNDVVDVTW